MPNPLVGWSYCRFGNFLGKVKFARMLQRAINFFNKLRSFIIFHYFAEKKFFRFEKVVMFSIFLMRFWVLCERSDHDFEIEAENLHSSVFKKWLFYHVASSQRKKAYLIDKTLFLARPSLN